MNTSHPHIHQSVRDLVENVGLADHEHRVGTGPHALHVEEVQAS